MDARMQRFDAYVEASRRRFLSELAVLCAQPSIAALGTGMVETSALIEDRLHQLGARVRRLSIDDSAPILYAELGGGPRTLLVYNHYDVQPPDPVEEWLSPPFELTERDGKLYARGVADDKGDLLCRLQAIEAYQEAVGPLPLCIKFIVEGEEEIGSPHLDAFAARHADLLQADGCLWETGGKDAARRCVLTLGVKGMCYLELSVTTAATDLHSSWGGVIPNAAWRLAWALSTLKDADERITVDGLMEQVRPVSEVELAQLAEIPFDEQKIKEAFGFAGFVRDLTGLDLLVQHFYRPTCDICGLKSGYIGEGIKTVLPCTASAKVSFRLVPDLVPEAVEELVRAHLDRRGFSDVKSRMLGGLRPARSSLDAPFVGACREAARRTYGDDPVIYPTSPGSGPLYALSRETPAVMAGISHENARLHAPNENIYLEDYFQGIHFVAELLEQFGRVTL